jgi:threonine dehydrogenase-like Zn-dependent dehydrogenase
MTRLAGARGRIVVVAIFADAPRVTLFDLFWKELTISGARVYEPEDYERAIELVAEGALPLRRLITSVEPLERLPELLAALGRGDADDVKVLLDCRA